jgi:hypothetical protein
MAIQYSIFAIPSPSFPQGDQMENKPRTSRWPTIVNFVVFSQVAASVAYLMAGALYAILVVAATFCFYFVWTRLFLDLFEDSSPSTASNARTDETTMDDDGGCFSGCFSCSSCGDTGCSMHQKWLANFPHIATRADKETKAAFRRRARAKGLKDSELLLRLINLELHEPIVGDGEAIHIPITTLPRCAIASAMAFSTHVPVSRSV